MTSNDTDSTLRRQLRELRQDYASLRGEVLNLRVLAGTVIVLLFVAPPETGRLGWLLMGAVVFTAVHVAIYVAGRWRPSNKPMQTDGASRRR